MQNNNNRGDSETILVRIDERLANAIREIEGLKDQIRDLKAEVKRDNEKYVTKEQFDPIQRAVISVISFVVMSVIAAMVGIVIIKPPVP